MNVLILSGSRNPEGQTAKAAQAFLQGVIDEGGQGEILYLPQINIERCRQCEDNGWGVCLSEGRCVIEDDLSKLVEKIAQSDAVVFATPVYFSDLSESLKTFLDRLRRICRHESTWSATAEKPAVGICVAGGGGGGAPTCAVNLERTLAHCGFNVIDIIPARRQNLDLKLDVLRATGKWVAVSLAAL